MARTTKVKMFRQALFTLGETIADLQKVLLKHTKEEIKVSEDLTSMYRRFRHNESMYRHLLHLQESQAKKGKQTTRMLQAICTGELKDGNLCNYKIRASMSTYMIGIPNCPNPFCKRKGKPFELQIDIEADAELIDEEVAIQMRDINALAKIKLSKLSDEEKAIQAEWEKSVRADDPLPL